MDFFKIIKALMLEKITAIIPTYSYLNPKRIYPFKIRYQVIGCPSLFKAVNNSFIGNLASKKDWASSNQFSCLVKIKNKNIT